MKHTKFLLLFLLLIFSFTKNISQDGCIDWVKKSGISQMLQQLIIDQQDFVKTTKGITKTKAPLQTKQNEADVIARLIEIANNQVKTKGVLLDGTTITEDILDLLDSLTGIAQDYSDFLQCMSDDFGYSSVSEFLYNEACCCQVFLPAEYNPIFPCPPKVTLLDSYELPDPPGSAIPGTPITVAWRDNQYFALHTSSAEAGDFGYMRVGILRFNKSTNTITYMTEAEISNKEIINSISWRDNEFIAVGCAVDNYSSDRRELFIMQYIPTTNLTLYAEREYNLMGVNSVGWHTSGNYLAVAKEGTPEASSKLEILKFDKNAIFANRLTSVATFSSAELNIGVTSLAWRDDTYIAASTPDGYIEVLEFDSTPGSESLSSLSPQASHDHVFQVNCVSWSPNKKYLAFAGNAGSGTNVNILNLDLSAATPLTLVAQYNNPGDDIRSITWKDDNFLAISSSISGGNNNWKLLQFKPLETNPANKLTSVYSFNHGSDVDWVAFSKDTNLLAMVGVGGTGPSDVRVHSVIACAL